MDLLSIKTWCLCSAGTGHSLPALGMGWNPSGSWCREGFFISAGGDSRRIEQRPIMADLDKIHPLKPEEPEVPLVVAGPDLQGAAGIRRHPAETGNAGPELTVHPRDRVVEALGPEHADNGCPAGLCNDEIADIPVVMPAEDDKASGKGNGHSDVDPLLRQWPAVHTGTSKISVISACGTAGCSTRHTDRVRTLIS